MNARLSSFLNASRWWAAFLVAAHHVRHVVLADAGDVTLHGPLIKGFYFLTSLGAQAVMVFFVISGYLVGGRTVTRLRERGFDLVDFASHRIGRIYTVLVPALIVGGSLDFIGLHAFNRSGMYTSGARHANLFEYFAITNNLNVTTFLGNLLMLEDIVTKRLGTNNPLWSLTYEWWYYCMFAAAIVFVTRRNPAGRVIATAALLAMIVLLPHALVAWVLIWSIGLATALYARTAFWKPAPWLGYVVLAVALVGLRVTEHTAASQHQDNYLSIFARSTGLALAYAFLLLAYHRDGRPLPLPRANEWFAKFSYTLYLVHVPMIVFVVCFLSDRFGVGFLQKPSATSLLYFAALLSLVVVYAWCFAQLTERHTARVRIRVLALLRFAFPSARSQVAVPGKSAG